MENNKKSVGTIALVVLLLIVTVVSLILATFAWAKYTEKVDDIQATATVAKWRVAATGGAATHTQTFNFVVANKLAPGTDGKIPVTISAAGSEVDVKYEVYVTGVTNKPTNLKFYGSTSAGAVNKLVTYGAGSDALSGEFKIAEGTIAINGADVNQYIFWEWPYESATANGKTADENDQIDTTDGRTAKTMNVTYKVVFTQVKPTPRS